MPPGTNHRLDLFRIQALDSDREFLQVKNLKTGIVTDLEVSGLFFAIGHEPASKFLGGQLDTDSDGYVLTKPGTTQTNVPGVFAAGDVQDKKYRQAITAAGSGRYFAVVICLISFPPASSECQCGGRWMPIIICCSSRRLSLQIGR
jgi:thioredoxin reductase